MKYKNISDETLIVMQSAPDGERSLSVLPGEAFVTSPLHATELLAAGQVEPVSAVVKMGAEAGRKDKSEQSK